MSKTKKLAALAAGLTAGSYTNDYVLKQLGGDKSLFDRVVSMAAGGLTGGITSGVVSSILDSDLIEDSPLGDLIEGVDDLLDDIF
jgi:hypothetical protein